MVKDVLNHIANNTKQVFVEIKEEASLAFNKFKEAPPKEKAWVLFKTFCVAVACGLIAFTVSALVASPNIPLIAAAFVLGGAYAFYHFARSARSMNELAVNQVVQEVKQVGQNALKAAREIGDQALGVVKNLQN